MKKDEKFLYRGKLLPQHEAFCQAYMAGHMTLKEAFLAAGYKESKFTHQRAKKLYDKPEIQKRLSELKKEMEQNSIASLEEIKNFLTRTIRQETEEEVLCTEGCGQGITETVKKTKKADIRSALKAADQLTRMLGAYEDKMLMGGAVQVVIKDDLNDEPSTEGD